MACYGWIVYRWLQEAGQQGDELLVRDAIAMGWYPAAYLVEIFPISLVRFLTFNSKTTVGHGWTIFASVCFASSGMFNLLLWLLTGRQFGFTLPPGDDYDDEDDEVAFGRGEPLQTDTTGTTGRWTGDTASYAVRRRGTNRSGSVSAYDTDAEVILVPIPKNSDAPNGDSIHAGLENGHEMAILNARSASLATQPRLNPQSSQTQLRQPHSSLPPSLHAAQRGMQPDLLPLPVSATPIGMAAGVVPGSDVDAYSTHSGNSRGYYAPPSPPQRPPRALQVSANGLPPSARAGSEDAPLPSRTSRNVRVLSPGAAAAARAMDVRTYRSMESIATGSGSGNISPTSGHSRRHSDERGSARGSRGSGSHARRSSEDAVMALTPSTGDTRDVPTSIPTLNVWPESPQVMEYPGDPNDPHSDAGFMRSLQYPLDNIILDPLPTHSHRRQHHHSSRRHPKSGSGAGLDPNTQLPNGVSSDSASDSLSAAAPSSVLYPASSQNVRSTDGSTRRHSIRRVPVPPLPNTTTSSAEGEIPPEPS
ncbi:hypothetical protein DL93DRAFT_299811 [Clavulina sp. PMI_390]|nr:hypothetical protein DL93DRAFT_299811 [Clavulina sp. PMI_390]